MHRQAKTSRPSRRIVEREFGFDAAPDGDGLTLSGYAAVFDSPTRIDSWEGMFDEQIARGAFKKTVAERTPVLMWAHGKDPAVGQVPIGAITTLREDARGLFVEARLHDNDHARPVRDAIASGAVRGMSIRFEPLDEAVDTSGDVPLRTLRAVKLHELGPVPFPAYADTAVGVRGDDARDMPDEYDQVACLACGMVNDGDCNFCPNCGAPALASAPPATTPAKSAAPHGAPMASAGAKHAPGSTTRGHQRSTRARLLAAIASHERA